MDTTRNDANSILSEIHFKLATFPAATQRVAKYVLENPHSVIRQSVAEISSYSHSGQASVIRFCNTLGFTGLKELKIALASELARSPGVTSQETSDLLGRIHAVANQQNAEIDTTVSQIDEELLAKAAAVICRSRRVFTYGAGVSGIGAELLEYRLLRLGCNAKAFRDHILAQEVLMEMDARDTLIAISDSGVTAETVRLAQFARKSGANVIAITCRANSELARSADIVLTMYGAGPPISPGSVSILARVALVIECMALTLETRTSGKEPGPSPS
ncbi:MurR/RpiR family transcriptional regulator [Mesorhizobium sp. VK23B]|uniref:MurR/RpiR family transcriptional regulator n=1 Tax=Mesorhizobium dulcispinae TaxID=3072316 RepID=A0ABU4XCI4_9HYPH|nr:MULTISPECIES: MurR/RpiR family transcriptional regulator [unclassified Mesorhizobium]MDX8465713.1 MurR/RpiR family transcriptional regulator [Mesorhizobium sp. VK23B]MDX8471485.1 MurR/RpiR family transcriptional regulator [Mesorhizobium sp. VK23A]